MVYNLKAKDFKGDFKSKNVEKNIVNKINQSKHTSNLAFNRL